MVTTTEINVTTGVRTVTEDYGDGTGTRTFYDEHGLETGTEQVTGLPVIDPDAVSEDEARARAVALAMALLDDPARLAQLVDQIAVGNTARGPLQYVNAAVQTAAAQIPSNPLQEETQ